MTYLKSLKRIAPYLKNNKLLLFVFIVLSILISVGGLIAPILNAKAITAITDGNIEEILRIGIIMTAVYIIIDSNYFFFHNVNIKFQNNITLGIENDVSNKIFKLQTLSFDQKGTGFFLERIRKEPDSMISSLSTTRLYLTRILTGIGVFVFVFLINPIIAIYLLICSGIILYINVVKTKKSIALKEIEKNIKESDTTGFGEVIRGIRDIKLLNFKDNMFKRIEVSQTNLIKAEEKRYRLLSFYSFIVGNMKNIFDFLLLLIGIYFMTINSLSAANFLIIFLYASRIFDFITNISYLYDALKDYHLSATRLYEVIDGIEYPYDVYGSKQVRKLNGEIKFDQVSFSYHKKEVLHQVSFSVTPGQTIGIVGKTGSGKSTLLHLIAKLYPTTTGTIYLDNHNLNDLTEQSIRDHISVISQNPYIFNMTIRENLKIVNPTISDKEMIRYCKIASAHEFICELENGYDTKLGENGVNLSGGQKQRIAIARALLKKSKILLLDEATSALDNHTQKEIHDAIKNLGENHTVIIVAHRLSTISSCDRILVMEKGTITADGPHYELLKTSKNYNLLYQLEDQKESVTL